MKRKVTIAAAAMLLAASLSGCAQQYTPSGTGVNVVDVPLPSGGTVTCVSATGGGIDCNWDEVAR